MRATFLHMVHSCIHASDGRLLFRTWREALALWDRLARGPAICAAVLMPTHLHAQLVDRDQQQLLFDVLRGYALWRNAARGEHGPVFRHDEKPTPIRGRAHIERTRRYIHLNPCRDGYAADPLAWPFSTHRDVVGLAAWPVCRPVHDPVRFHAYVSSDPEVKVRGSQLPSGSAPSSSISAELQRVFAAVSALTRSTAGALAEHGPARDLFIRAARALTRAGSSQIARLAGVDGSTVRRCPRRSDALIERVALVMGDPRFPLLWDGDLRNLSTWSQVRHLR